VTLRSDMRTLVVLSNTPHPLDPERRYSPKPVALAVRNGPEAAGADDPCRRSCEQAARAFELTDDYYL